MKWQVVFSSAVTSGSGRHLHEQPGGIRGSKQCWWIGLHPKASQQLPQQRSSLKPSREYIGRVASMSLLSSSAMPAYTEVAADNQRSSLDLTSTGVTAANNSLGRAKYCLPAPTPLPPAVP